MYNILNAGLRMEWEPEKFDLKVSLEGREDKVKYFTGIPYVMIKEAGPALSLSDAKCESKPVFSGTYKGVKAVYTDFKVPEGYEEYRNLKVILELRVLYDGWLSYNVSCQNEPDSGVFGIHLQAVSFGEEAGHGYTVLPRMQGILLDACSPEVLGGGKYLGRIYDRDAYIPVLGQITETDKPYGRGFGYMMIIDTPDDAMYLMEHEAGGDTLITPRFIESLNKIGYTRRILYKFDTDFDYVRIASIMRIYLEERGRVVTLKEKIAANPNVKYITEAPVIHTDIAISFDPSCQAYDHEHPENNEHFTTFDERARQLEELKKNGLEKAYIHLDGWGRAGYDSMHPDVFPPFEKAGGAAGMKRLAEKCKEIGYVFGIHDQYRDYYVNADSFDPDKAVKRFDGTSQYYDVWCGGKQTFLCATFALDYVKRNYAEFERLGIDVRGSYLDVFAIVEEDECLNPDHMMTRKECAEYRKQCFSYLTSKGIIPSSEEPNENIVPVLALCHHAPYYVDDICNKSHLVGVPVPFFNLVLHDSIVTPWFTIWENGFGFPAEYDILGLAYMNGGNVYWPVDGVSGDDKKTLRDGLEFFKKVATAKLVNHEIIDGDVRKRKSVFLTDEGKKVSVFVDFDAPRAEMVRIYEE